MALATRKPKPKGANPLHATRSITVTIEASESNLQRLAAYLLFSDNLNPLADATPEEWDDAPLDALVAVDEAKMIDYAVVRRDLVGKLGQYVERFGEDETRSLLRAHGAERLTLVPDDKLLALHNIMRDALAIPAR